MKKSIALLLVLTMMLAMAACGQNDTSVESSAEMKDSAVTETTASHYPVTVTDQAGREVVIEKAPQRLISSYYITTSLLMALDQDEYLVGVEDNADLRPIYGMSSPAILELPSIGTAKELDLEACAALSPDLAILPMKVKDSVDALEELGITVLLVNPESQELLIEMIQLVATATNTEEKAEALVGFIEAQEEELTKSLADVETPSVYLASNSSFLSTAGNAMYQSDMIRLAGGINAASEIEDTYWAEIDYEQLLTWDPEYIILPSSAKYTTEEVMADPNLAGCRAIMNGNVYQVPGHVESWDSPVPGSILGAFWLANILHPEVMTDADCTNIMDEYYETFYQFTYSEK